jgi:hypothetical protein
MESETLETMTQRHKAESRELEGKIRALMKTAKKSNKSEIEAKSVQLNFDLVGKHRLEIDELEEQLGNW